MKQKQLSAALAIEWARMAHIFYLDALMVATDWTRQQFAFHGGTSLHLSWNSARFSEDLDFLLAPGEHDFGKRERNILLHTQERFRGVDPRFVVDIQDRSKDRKRLITYRITVRHPHYQGAVMVKAEFWLTTKEYLKKYPTELRTPGVRLDVDINVQSSPVPAATLETAYADKLTALATRPYLKWRDLYDLWWIGTLSRAEVDVTVAAAQFTHNIRAYTPLQQLPAAKALRLFLQHDRQAIIDKADPDLKRWLPPSVWKSLDAPAVESIVDYVRYALASVADTIEQPKPSSANVNLTRVPTQSQISLLGKQRWK
jgi:predicted nucleotidyltransferase component of viral defense system